MIHPTAVIHPRAEVPLDAEIGPYCVIDEGVRLGPNCWLGPSVHLTGQTEIGPNNRFHAGCVIGDAPQDLKYQALPTRVRIGAGNTFREHVTIHRSNKLEEDTVIGSNNYLMAASHVGHNSVLGDNVILANAALVAGHVTIQDRAFISATAMIHQFVRVGAMALMQGGSGVSKDLPPFTIAMANNTICGLNIIGLRRAGVSPAHRLELKRAYRLLFRSGLRMKDAIVAARVECASPFSEQLISFVETSKRGVCADIRGAGTQDDPDEDAS
ncbi:MAG TPA: acyl-ACP--UDP-N-acetylglucosamine O-acyltransferase [Methylomirabilota bacterium]|nr:acyl-ACP--UDP-N-acetylglucosamine O-acyltransferase [Methylomirabilota bacterium]